MRWLDAGQTSMDFAVFFALTHDAVYEGTEKFRLRVSQSMLGTETVNGEIADNEVPLRVAFTDGGGNGETLLSATTDAVNTPATVNS